MIEDFWLSTLESRLGTPWHVKTDSPNTNDRRDYVCNVQGRPILELSPAGGDYTVEQYTNVRNIASTWPELLAALIEATLSLEEAGIKPTATLVELIKHCGGPDLHSRMNSKPIGKPEPRKWNNATQSTEKDNVSQTKPSTERLLPR